MPPLTNLTLNVDQPRRMGGAGELVVESGIVWVTEKGRADDVFLHAGQRYFLRRAGDAIIEAMSEGTRISFEPRSPITGILRCFSGIAHAVAMRPKRRMIDNRLR